MFKYNIFIFIRNLYIGRNSENLCFDDKCCIYILFFYEVYVDI